MGEGGLWCGVGEGGLWCDVAEGGLCASDTMFYVSERGQATTHRMPSMKVRNTPDVYIERCVGVLV